MPDIEITIGDRKFYVACRPGEEHFLNAAAKMLDSEAVPTASPNGPPARSADAADGRTDACRPHRFGGG